MALVLTSMAVAFLVLELFLRLTDEDPWYERLVKEQHPANRCIDRSIGIPGRRLSTERWQKASACPLFQFGERQYRVRRPLDDVVPPDPEAYRILFLGDSFTYGLGIKEEKAVFPTQVTSALGQKTGERWPARFEFYNGGIPGSLTSDWIGLYRESVDRFDPNLVVAVFFLRDGTRVVGSVSGLREIRKAMNRLRDESLLFRSSRVYRRLVENRKQHEFGRSYFEATIRAYLGPPEDTQEWKLARGQLLRMRNETVERGGKFVLVIFPVLFGLSGDYPLQAVMDRIRLFANANDIPVLSLLPAFQGEEPSMLWVSSLDQHPNERAHAIAAHAITEFLVEHITTPEKQKASAE